MRTLLATLACITGLICIYLFGTGIFNGATAPGSAAFWKAVLAPFEGVSALSLAVLCVGLVAFLMSVVLSSGFSRSAGELSWARVLHVGLAFNALVAAGLIVAVVVLRAGLTPAAIGGLVAVASLEAVIGLVLGVTLLFVKNRNNKVFFPCFSLNVIDVAAIAVVIVLGAAR
ncbi:MAG: hypothetical protein JXP34_07220 [Planctomycetes bacterium]|nr:hypothetical protein [Planctomycetota bacterium]